MTEFGDIANALVKLILGKDAWPFWFAITIVLWIIFFREENIEWIFYAAIFCSLMTVFILLAWIKEGFNWCKARSSNLKREEEQRNYDLAKEEALKLRIWQIFYIIPESTLDNICLLLDLETIPHISCCHFLRTQNNLSYDVNYAICSAISYAKHNFQIRDNEESLYYTPLFEDKSVYDGHFLYFQSYLYSLIENYKQTKTKTFL